MLRDILDRVIAIDSPDELEGLSNRWRVSTQQEAITWQELVREFGGIIALDHAADHLDWFVRLSLHQTGASASCR